MKYFLRLPLFLENEDRKGAKGALTWVVCTTMLAYKFLFVIYIVFSPANSTLSKSKKKKDTCTKDSCKEIAILVCITR